MHPSVFLGLWNTLFHDVGIHISALPTPRDVQHAKTGHLIAYYDCSDCVPSYRAPAFDFSGIFICGDIHLAIDALTQDVPVF